MVEMQEVMVEPVKNDSTVYLLDDDQQLCEAMRKLFVFSGLHAETFSSGHDFLTHDQFNQPGCLVADVRLPDISGLEVQQRLAAKGLSIPVIIITGYGDVATAVKAISAGAFDFLEKPFSDEVLLQSVRRAIDFDASNHRKARTATAFRARRARLSSRERQVMDQIVSGYQTKEIAIRLGLSPRTVEKYRAFVMTKMQARNLADLIQMGLEADVIEHRNGGPPSD